MEGYGIKVGTVIILGIKIESFYPGCIYGFCGLLTNFFRVFDVMKAAWSIFR